VSEHTQHTEHTQQPTEHAEDTGYRETRLEKAVGRGMRRVTSAALGPYQTAVVRIGFAATWLFFLLREWPHRRELYGPDGPWSWELGHRLVESNHAFTVLLWNDGTVWFESVYTLAVLSAAALALGWRTRLSSVLFMVGVLSLQNRSVFMGDGGDNIIHLMAIYLVCTRCAQVWSLDARRAARKETVRDAPGVVLWSLAGLALGVVSALGDLTAGWALVYWGLWGVQGLWWAARRFAPGEPRTILDVFGNLVHNGALAVIIAEVCLVYSTAGWYKIQGSRWQDGSAVYYPLNLDYFAPWPALNDVIGSSGLIVMLMTYGTVMIQVAFPFTLFNRKVKNVLLAVMITEHLSIAVLLGLPFFSLAMIAADSVFLPTNLLTWLGRRAGALRARLTGRRAGDGTDGTGEAGADGHGQAAPTGARSLVG
jgi:hypothetical protein